MLEDFRANVLNTLKGIRITLTVVIFDSNTKPRILPPKRKYNILRARISRKRFRAQKLYFKV